MKIQEYQNKLKNYHKDYNFMMRMYKYFQIKKNFTKFMMNLYLIKYKELKIKN